MILRNEFFSQNTLLTAKRLLGKKICRKMPSRKMFEGIIVETEAYQGENDLACHASKGMTLKNKILYDRPGTMYVYFTYGMHYMFNIVTESEGCPTAVLVRAVMPVSGMEYMAQRRYNKKKITEKELVNLANGPAKFTRAFGINGKFNGKFLGNDIWIEDGIEGDFRITRDKRIGVEYAGKSKDWEYRFYINKKPFINYVSKLKS